jgi:hypothetical protein
MGHIPSAEVGWIATVSSKSRFVAAHNHTIIRKYLTLNVMISVCVLLTARFDSDGEALKQFVATRADNMNAYNAFFWPNDHQLEQRWFLVLRGDHGEVECAERRLI